MAGEDVLESLAEEYPAWWIDLLGEQNHVGGIDATRWLYERSGLAPGRSMLDAGAFVGGAARFAAAEGATAWATDVVPDFLAAGRQLEFGERVRWAAADSRRLPFRDATFDSVWCLDAPPYPREFTRVARPGATLCLCTEVPADGRGGFESLQDEWSGYGWTMTAHRPMTLEALQAWRAAEAQLASRRQHFEPRYSHQGYLHQLDLLAHLVQSYERGGMGHGLFVFRR